MRNMLIIIAETRVAFGTRLLELLSFRPSFVDTVTSVVEPTSTGCGLVGAELAAFGGFWQRRTIAVMLRHTQADDIGLPRGVQIIAARFGDRTAIACAAMFEALGASLKAPPMASP